MRLSTSPEDAALPIFFNHLLFSAGLSVPDVRLLRHQEKSAPGRSPYELWRDKRDIFEQYQARQRVTNAPKFGDVRHWASFVATPEGQTLFVGIYRVEGRNLLEIDSPWFNAEGIDLAGTCHTYDLVLTEHHMDLIGRLVVDWGSGTRSWVQRSDRQDKAVIEVTSGFCEPDFPGYQEFQAPLSHILSLPAAWAQALRLGRGIYVLTCPRTKEQYVGAAYGTGEALRHRRTSRSWRRAGRASCRAEKWDLTGTSAATQTKGVDQRRNS
jgi:hypothetical protein